MKLFFSYRHEDTEDLAGRLRDRLCIEFGAENIFTDHNSIPAGVDWKSLLEKSVQESDVVLALMGQKWLNCVNKAGERRLFAADDIVRFELEGDFSFLGDVDLVRRIKGAVRAIILVEDVPPPLSPRDLDREWR